MSSSKLIAIRFSSEEFEQIEKYYQNKEKAFKSLSSAVREIILIGLNSDRQLIATKKNGLTPTSEAIASFLCCGILSVCLIVLTALPVRIASTGVLKAVFGTALFFFVCYYAFNFFFLVYKVKQYEQ